MLPESGPGGQEESGGRKAEKQKSRHKKKRGIPESKRKAPDIFPEGPKGKQRKEGEAKQSRKSKAKGKEAAEKQSRKRKTHRRKPGGVPWHTMCPVIFAPTVPAPGRFSFPLLNAARGALPLSCVSVFHSVYRILSLRHISVFRSIIPHAAHCLSHGISVFRSAFFRPSGTARPSA